MDLLPWIAGGYGLLVLSQVFEKVCFAHGRTGMVLFIQALGGAVGLLVAYAGIRHEGLIGAAMAVPIYFGFQLLITFAAAQIVDHNVFAETDRMYKKAVQNTEVEYHRVVQSEGK